MDIGIRIREARKSNKLSQVELAQRADIAVNSLRLYEANKRQPRPDTLERIASALGIPARRLLGGGLVVTDKAGWESDKSARLSMAIDSGLLRTLELLAKEDGISLEDEVEQTLYWSADERINEPPQGDNAP